VDRGPYVGGREFDLTAATAQRRHFHGPGVLLTTR
jgi:rare lipoprotein A